jgi:O-acetyl-ADP-ribose deacetylase (regulator of RNase III)
MGKGIALQFRQAYPQMYRAYQSACQKGEVWLGRVHVFGLGSVGTGPRWIINFPTKGHWRCKSRLVDIESGLADLVVTVAALRIQSIALPRLGCGYGGLGWKEVRPLIEQAFKEMPEVRVLLYEL